MGAEEARKVAEEARRLEQARAEEARAEEARAEEAACAEARSCDASRHAEEARKGAEEVRAEENDAREIAGTSGKAMRRRFGFVIFLVGAIFIFVSTFALCHARSRNFAVLELRTVDARMGKVAEEARKRLEQACAEEACAEEARAKEARFDLLREEEAGLFAHAVSSAPDPSERANRRLAAAREEARQARLALAAASRHAEEARKRFEVADARRHADEANVWLAVGSTCIYAMLSTAAWIVIVRNASSDPASGCEPCPSERAHRDRADGREEQRAAARSRQEAPTLDEEAGRYAEEAHKLEDRCLGIVLVGAVIKLLSHEDTASPLLLVIVSVSVCLYLLVRSASSAPAPECEPCPSERAHRDRADGREEQRAAARSRQEAPTLDEEAGRYAEEAHKLEDRCLGIVLVGAVIKLLSHEDTASPLLLVIVSVSVCLYLLPQPRSANRARLSGHTGIAQTAENKQDSHRQQRAGMQRRRASAPRSVSRLRTSVSIAPSMQRRRRASAPRRRSGMQRRRARASRRRAGAPTRRGRRRVRGCESSSSLSRVAWPLSSSTSTPSILRRWQARGRSSPVRLSLARISAGPSRKHRSITTQIGKFAQTWNGACSARRSNNC
ncbi:hypothetical protein T492DRAFT_1095185 [Pavlovales sp. CCMP2436]|nr:hypothetical protein T492DRAFT_1095185 [Pavlovales sp. CCMP2436]